MEDLQKEVEEQKQRLQELRQLRKQRSERRNVISNALNSTRSDALGDSMQSQDSSLNLTAVTFDQKELASNAESSLRTGLDLMSPLKSFRLQETSPELQGRKFFELRQRIEREHLLSWYAEQREIVVEQEANERIDVMRFFIFQISRTNCHLSSHIKVLLAEQQREAELARKPSSRILALLQGGHAQEDADLPEDHAMTMIYSMVQQYKIDRDTEVSQLKASVETHKREADRLHDELRAQHLAMHQLRLSKEEQEDAIQNAKYTDSRIQELLKLRNGILALENEKAEMLRQAAQQEQHANGLEKNLEMVLSRRDERENGIIAACREGEEAALAKLMSEHRQKMEKVELEMQHLKKRKSGYKEKVLSMQAVYDECLTARSMLQSEVMELHSRRTKSEAEYHCKLLAFKKEQEKNDIEKQRRILELERALAESRQAFEYLKSEVALKNTFDVRKTPQKPRNEDLVTYLNRSLS